MEYTTQTFLVSDQATKFAVEMGFHETSLSTPKSQEIWKKWKENNCQPNFWTNVLPNSSQSCGPYKPRDSELELSLEGEHFWVGRKSHDTIAMIVIDGNGSMAVGTSTNGATHKIVGRVGDSPIIGAGAYVDNDIGGCGATGDGDVTMRFLPCYQAVESMRHGMSPTQAAEDALARIAPYFPHFKGALVTLNKKGEVGAAAHGWVFEYSYQDETTGGKPKIVTVQPKQEKIEQKI
eukprot:TRINITY_DN6530_c0_g1_i10.p1 TRINITY_DN6530_c0_g1~~TRINITY_DN6530_c0_g1_i10.p1  ORF type:complete len:235 (-),score=55.54 TRINITY_DN6530_c0_g1_i10:174-878(-)